MGVSPQGMSVQALYRSYRDGQLVVNRQYQRKLVWTVAEKQSLIDSILKDYPLPLFLLAEKPYPDGGGKSFYEIIDGMQRLNAIFSFIENGFQVDGKCFDIREFARAKQAADAGNFKAYPDDVERWSAEDCANLLDYQLAVTIFPGEQDARITEVFGRINSGGRQLSDQERRQAGVLSPFAEVVRTLAAEIRGDVSRDTLLLSEMPEISIETSQNRHGYSLKAEDIFWTYQGILRTGDLRESDDEQVLADICASILFEEPVEASGEFLNKLYSSSSDEARDVNALLATYGKDRLMDEVKTTFSAVRTTIESVNPDRFAFRSTVYPKPTSNAQKSPFFAVFMAFHTLIFREGMVPTNAAAIMKALDDVADRIQVGQKHIKTADRKENIAVVNGLIRGAFAKEDVSVLSHGPGLVFDFENSIRRSKTETPRYEFKQGILRLYDKREVDTELLQSLIETFAAIANVGPGADGFVYVGIADKPKDAERVKGLDGVEPVRFEHVDIVGIDREAKVMGLSVDRYMRTLEDAVRQSSLSEPLKTQLLTSMDVIAYKGLSVVRIRVPRQTNPTFVGDNCYMRNGSGTREAKGPQIAAITNLFH